MRGRRGSALQGICGARARRKVAHRMQGDNAGQMLAEFVSTL
jgi:hypothetical protein